MSRRRNPGDVERAAELYEEFREQPVQQAQFQDIDLPEAVFEVGICEALAYVTTHAGKPTHYVHAFVQGSRPRLYSSGRKNDLFIFGGRFRMTARGIVDLDRNGREATPLTAAQVRDLLALKA